jgi:hypothetical protein
MKSAKNVYVLSILFWSFYGLMILGGGDDSVVPNPYYLRNHATYTSISDFLEVLTDLSHYGLNLFTYCCDVINYLGDFFGYSYQDMNIILFVVTPPLLFGNLICIIVSQIIVINNLKK